jgi:hypothetical protein
MDWVDTQEGWRDTVLEDNGMVVGYKRAVMCKMDMIHRLAVGRKVVDHMVVAGHRMAVVHRRTVERIMNVDRSGCTPFLIEYSNYISIRYVCTM